MSKELPQLLMMELVNKAAEQNYEELKECGGNEMKIRLYCKQRAYERVLSILLSQEMSALAKKAELLYECMNKN